MYLTFAMHMYFLVSALTIARMNNYYIYCYRCLNSLLRLMLNIMQLNYHLLFFFVFYLLFKFSFNKTFNCVCTYCIFAISYIVLQL